MIDIAQLGIRVDSTQAKQAAPDLNNLAKAARNADNAVDDLAASSKVAGKSVQQIGAGAKSSAASVSAFQRALGGNGVRNAALQLGQVTQQMASGTSAARALAIQLPDLLLGFGTFGAIAGVAAGALGPVVAKLLETKDASERVEDAIENLNDEVDRVVSLSAAAAKSISELSRKYGENAEQVRRNVSALRDLAVLDSVKALTDTVVELSGGVAGAVLEFSKLEDRAGRNAKNVTQLMADLEEETGLTAAQARAMNSAFNDMAEAKGLEGATRAAQRLYDTMLATFGSVEKIPPELQAVARAAIMAANSGYDIQSALDSSAKSASSLSSELSVAAGHALQLATNLAQAPAGIEGMRAKAEQLTAQIAALDAGYGELAASSAGYRKQLEQQYGLADAASEAERAHISAVINRQVAEYENVEKLNDEYREKVKVLNDVEKAAKKSGSALSDADKEAIRLQRRFETDLTNDVQTFTDTVANGMLNGFDGTLEEIGDLFKRWLAQMISTALANPILVSMGLNPVGYSSAAVSLSGSSGGASGAGGSGLGILGQLSGIGGSILSGGLGLVSSLFGAGGGLGAAGTYLSSVLGTATTSIGAFGAAVGAIALPVLAVAAVFSFFRTKTKQLDSGLVVTAKNMEILVQSFSTVEKSKFWGLSKKVSTSYSDLEEAVAGPIERAIATIQTGILDAAAALNIGSEAFKGFEHIVTISTQGLSDEDAQAKIIEAMTELGDAYAGMIRKLHLFTDDGETASEALSRLSTSLLSVNDMADLLGHSLYKANLKGADMASDLADAFGGLDAMATAVSAYWSAFYTEAERTETTIRRLEATFEDLGVTMPQSREAYRALVESIDTTSESGRELYAALISMASALDEVLPQVEAFTLSMSGILSDIDSDVQDALDAAEQNARITEQAAALWYRTATTLRDFLSDLLNTDLTAASTAQQAVVNRSRYETAYEAARGGDVEAAQELPELAQAYLQSARSNSSTDLEYRRIAARVQSELNFAAGIAELEGANDDILTTLYEQQIEVLTSLGNFLQLEGLTGEDLASLDTSIQELVEDWDGTVAEFDSVLSDLASAIEDAQNFSYDTLLADLDVAISLADQTDIPDWLRDVIEAAGDDIRTTLDFIIRRNDLTADLRWIAVNSVSEHIKNIEFLVDTGVMTAEQEQIVYGVSSAFSKVITFWAESKLGAYTSLALDEASDLLKTITFVVQALPEDVQDIVLNKIEPLQKQINLMLGDTIPDEQQELALADAKTFRRVINIVAGELTDDLVQELALADPAKFKRKLNIIAGTLPSGTVQTLALDAATEFKRIIDIVDGAMVTEETAALALAASGELRRNIVLILTQDLDAETRAIALAGNSDLSRTVTATLAADIDEYAKQLALGTVGAYAVSISLSFAPNIDEEVRKIVFEGAGVYAASIQAVVDDTSLTAKARRILLTQQGRYTANIVGVLASSMSTKVRRLLLEANTSAMRAVTVSALYADSMTAEDLELLTTAADDIYRTVVAAVDTAGLSEEGLLYLVQLGYGNAFVQKSILGEIVLGALSEDEKAILSAVDSWATVMISAAFDLSALEGDARHQALLDAADRGFTTTVFAAFDLSKMSNERRERLLDAAPVQFNSQVRATFDLSLMSNDRRKTLLDAIDQSFDSTIYAKFGMAGISTERRARLIDAKDLSFESVIKATFDLPDFSTGTTRAKRIRKLLDASNLSFTSTVSAGFSIANLTKRGLQLLDALDTTFNSTAVAKFKTGNLTVRGLKLLDATDLNFSSTLIAAEKLTSLSDDALTLLRATTSTIKKTINGKINLDSLNTRQKALLDAISGVTAGKITLAGTFQYTPSQAFQKLYEGTNDALADLKTPLDSLSDHLDDLRVEIAKQNAAVEKQERVSELNNYVASLQTDAAGNPLVNDTVLAKMAKITGQDISGLGSNAAARKIAGYSAIDDFETWNVDATGIKGLRASLRDAKVRLAEVVSEVVALDDATGGGLAKTGWYTAPYVEDGRLAWTNGPPNEVRGASDADLATWRSKWWANGALEDQLWAADAAVAALEKQISSFAGGGYTGDAARSGGMDGQGGFLAMMHPRETVIDETRQGGVIGELRALRAENQALREELAAMRDEQRQLGLRADADRRKIRKVAEKGDRIGVPVRNPDDGTKLEVN